MTRRGFIAGATAMAAGLAMPGVVKSAAAARPVSSFNISVASYLNSGSTAYWNIYSLRVYNRPLTAEEIAHNYAVDKARFNLP